LRRVHSASGRQARPSEWKAQMNRLLLLASIVTLAASRVLAQSTSQPAPAPSASTDARQKHIRDTTAYGSLSLLLSRMAKSKVTHPMFKQFVDFEIAEQETVGAILKAIQTNAAPTGSTPSPSDADLMQNLDDAGKASVEKLRALRAGSELDRDYIRYEVEGHRNPRHSRSRDSKNPKTPSAQLNLGLKHVDYRQRFCRVASARVFSAKE
jgi:putative membrane protein